MESDLRRVFILVLLSPSLHLASSNLREQFIYIKNEFTWAEADEYCRTHHDGLITVMTEAQDDMLGQDEGWIGLRQIDGKGRWPGGELFTDSRSILDHELSDDKPCALRGEDKWRRKDCNENRNFFCIKKTLVLIRKRRTWEDALRYCRNQRVNTIATEANYDLATLVTTDDHLFAYEKAQNATTHEVWTGLRYLAGSWLWVGDGGQEVPTGLPSCPDQHNVCGSVSQTLNVTQASNCMEKRNFFCRKIT